MTLDADSMRDSQRAIVGRIEHVYLTVGGGRGIGGREVPAGRGDVGTVVAVTAGGRDESAGCKRLRRRGRQQANEYGYKQHQ